MKGTLKKEFKTLKGVMDNSSSALDSKLESLKVNVNNMNSNVNSKHQSLNSNLNSKIQSLTSNTNSMNSNLNLKFQALTSNVNNMSSNLDSRLQSLNSKLESLGKGCSSDKFACGILCLDRELRCDGTRHCSGGQDEQGCSCDKDFHRVGSQCIQWVHQGNTWDGGQAYCEKIGANLAQPDDIDRLWNFMKTINEPGGHPGHWWHIGAQLNFNWIYKGELSSKYQKKNCVILTWIDSNTSILKSIPCTKGGGYFICGKDI